MLPCKEFCIDFQLQKYKLCDLPVLILRELVENPHVPNAGFLEDVVFEDPALILASEVSDSCEGDDGTSINKEEIGDVVDVKDDHGPASTTLTYMANEGTEQLVSSMGDVKITESAAANELNADNAEDQHPSSVEEVDALLDKCLLQALHTTVKDNDLPIPGSTLWYNDFRFL